MVGESCRPGLDSDATAPLARPKSSIFTAPPAVSLTLPGLRSRCTTPLSCAASRPAATSRQISRASAAGSGPFASRAASVGPVHVLEDEVAAALGLLEAVDGGDVRMAQARQQLGLALEARQPLRVEGEEFGQRLDGDVAPQPRVAGAVHHPHAAGAGGADDLIGADLGSR